MAGVPYHIVQRGKSKVWYVWWLNGGKKVWRRILSPDGSLLDKTTPRNAVMKHAAMIYVQAVSSQHPLELPKSVSMAAKHTIITHDDLIKAYRRGREHEWDALTVKQYANWFKSHKEFFGSTANIRDVTVQAAEEFRNWLLLEKRLASRTVTERLAFIRRVFQWAVDIGELDRNPFKIVKAPKPKPVRENDPFSPEEVHAILHAAKERFPWFYPCVYTAALTGARRNVLIHLQVHGIDHHGKRLVVPPEIAKHDKRHNYALPDDLYQVLFKFSIGRSPDSSLFPSKMGRRMSPKTFDLHVDKHGCAHAWRRLLNAAKVKPRGIHNLRSAVDSNLVAAGVSLDLAVSVTGHTREIAERHYLKIDQEKQRQTIAKLADLYSATVGSRATAPSQKVQITLTTKDAETLKQWLMSQDSPKISGANSGANCPNRSQAQQYQGLRNMAERGGFEPPIRVYPV